MAVNFTIHPFLSDTDDGPLYAIVPDDHTDGFVLGTIDDVRLAASAINRLLETGSHDGEIDHHDERLGTKWITIAEAVLYAAQLGKSVPAVTIRRACISGHLSNARKRGRDWRFPRSNFLGWLSVVHSGAGRPREWQQSSQ